MAGLAVSVVLLSPAMAVPTAPRTSVSPEGPGDAAFLEARAAFTRGESVRLDRAKAAMDGHPLKPWAEYWQLRLRLDGGDSADVPGFLQRQAGSYLADRLRGDWVRKLGETGDWEGVRREADGLIDWDRPARCYFARASDSADALRPLLDEPKALPDACVEALTEFVARGQIGDDDLWRHFRRLGEKKLANDAARLAPLFKTQLLERKSLSKALDAVAANPLRYLERLPADFSRQRSGRELAINALQRLAMQDPALAARHTERLAALLDPAGAAYAWGQVALFAAYRQMPEAQAWFERATGTVKADPALSELQMAWRARVALRVQDWAALEVAIAAMPEALAETPDWVYWQGRALAARGRAADARLRYERIAGQANFYGNLASEELGRLINVPPRVRPGSTDLAHVAAMPGLQRAKALIRLDMRNEGLREWGFTMRGLSDRQLLAAAEIARTQELWDRAIHAATRTQTEHDFNLRFLAPYREQVQSKTDELALDNGWVYGLMRQESRFITRAQSSVGAQGLMQVMPATGKWVAKKINLQGYQPHHIAEMDTNVTLGTHYLKLVLDSLDNHPVLASAAYNAGPGRARLWRAEVPLEGAIYAETIPFSETRDYVKNVMSNAVYYNALFEGKAQSLKALLGVIRAKGSGEIGVEKLP
ncbi:MAG: lytic transglycosylase domain-containing protein [Rhodocyclaceae bacterium]|nr:lytic transglycosylase domain-containing protein [Rhodocyclaceae bacterium]